RKDPLGLVVTPQDGEREALAVADRRRVLVGPRLERPQRSPRIFAGEHRDARLRELVADAVLVAILRQAACTVPSLGDTRRRDRVRLQERRDVSSGEAVPTRDLLEEGRHSVGVVSGRGKYLDADAIRLVLVRPREVDLPL